MGSSEKTAQPAHYTKSTNARSAKSGNPGLAVIADPDLGFRTAKTALVYFK